MNEACPAPGIHVVPVRTPTLPPATHTNTYVVGEGRLTVFDPASPWEDEQQRLARVLEDREATGERVERIVLTHHHGDHVGGAEALRARFSRDGRSISIAAHAETAARVGAHIRVDAILADGQSIDCGGRTLQSAFTPGHAPGHLVFVDRDSGAVVAGDMVAGVGTILIDPIDGDLGLYLASLERMKGLAPSVLLPAHGPPLTNAVALLSFYIAHRHQRTEQVRSALDRLGSASPADLVPAVYPHLAPEAHFVAEVQITSHLLWMVAHGLARKGPRARFDKA